MNAKNRIGKESECIERNERELKEVKGNGREKGTIHKSTATTMRTYTRGTVLYVPFNNNTSDYTTCTQY